MGKPQFLNYEHEKSFVERVMDLPDRYRKSKEFQSVLFLTTGNEELGGELFPYFNPQIGELDFTAMFEEKDFSSRLSVLAKLAVVLYDGGLELDISELSRLDKDNFELAINAIRLRYGKDQEKGLYQSEPPFDVIY